MSIIRQLGYGLCRFYNKILIKLNTLKGNPKSIANGFATGAAISVTPLVGFHSLLSLIVAKVTRQNSIAALLGTVIGNPWTFPFIWYVDLHLGTIILQREKITDNIDFIIFFKELFHSVIKLDFDGFFSDIYPILLPMLIGCIPLYILVWIIFSQLLSKALMQKQSNGERQ